MPRALSVAAADSGTFTFNLSFSGGARCASTFVASSASWHRPENSTPVRLTSSATATGRRCWPRAKRSLSEDKATTLSAFEMYEFHSTQSGTHIHPGETFDLDYSLMRAFTFSDSRLQVGLIGYGAWQTTAKTGPQITPAEEAQRYRVNALGAGANFVLPARKVTLSFKYFDEFSNQWTYQGYSLQISAGVSF